MYRRCLPARAVPRHHQQGSRSIGIRVVRHDVGASRREGSDDVSGVSCAFHRNKSNLLLAVASVCVGMACVVGVGVDLELFYHLEPYVALCGAAKEASATSAYSTGCSLFTAAEPPNARAPPWIATPRKVAATPRKGVTTPTRTATPPQRPAAGALSASNRCATCGRSSTGWIIQEMGRSLLTSCSSRSRQCRATPRSRAPKLSSETRRAHRGHPQLDRVLRIQDGMKVGDSSTATAAQMFELLDTKGRSCSPCVRVAPKRWG